MRAPNLSKLMMAGALAFCTVLSITAQKVEVLDNAKIVGLARAGFGDQVIISKINSSSVAVDSSQTALLELKSAGVSDAVIVAFLARSGVGGARVDVCRADQLKLLGSTEVKVVTIKMISGKSAVTGQVLELAVADDVLVNGKVVVAKSTPVRAIVSEAKKPGMVGRSGRLSIRFDSTTSVDGQKINLRSAKSGAGGDNFGTALTLSYFLGVGLLIPGKNAEIKPGTVVTAFTDEQKCVRVGSGDP